uniref:Uncharacterized protein n=1 Tax=Rhizophora mucronata TaxID=61149 RepID=A0A2P2NLZ9_RHIMU
MMRKVYRVYFLARALDTFDRELFFFPNKRFIHLLGLKNYS